MMRGIKFRIPLVPCLAIYPMKLKNLSICLGPEEIYFFGPILKVPRSKGTPSLIKPFRFRGFFFLFACSFNAMTSTSSPIVYPIPLVISLHKSTSGGKNEEEFIIRKENYFQYSSNGGNPSMYKVYDISMPIYQGMPVYKNKPEKQPAFERSTQNYVSETRISMDVHCGTHVDAPLHMVLEGETMETISLEQLVGPCRVLDMTHVADGITAEDFHSLDIQQGEFLLLKTKNSMDESFNPDFIFVKEDAAQYLANIGVKGIGIDALGIERSQAGHPTHKTLFGNGIIIIEGLRLQEVPSGPYFMVAAPIKLMGTDAAPARVILLEGL